MNTVLLPLFLLLPVPQESSRAEEPIEKLVETLVSGSEAESSRAAEKIEERGPENLRFVIEARSRGKDEARRNSISDLVLRLKFHRELSPDERALLDSLRKRHITVAVESLSGYALMQLLSEIYELNLVVDPVGGEKYLEARESLRMENVPMYQVLDRALGKHGMDYDVRYGVVWISTPQRLGWMQAPDPAPSLTEEQKKSAELWLGRLKEESAEEREKATVELRKIGPALIPLLKERVDHPDVETSVRCRVLLAEFRSRLQSFVSRENTWRGEEDPSGIGRKLECMKMDLDVTEMSFLEVIGFLVEYTGLTLHVDDKLREDDRLKKPLRWRVRDVLVSQALELLTLPFGLDVSLQGDALLIHPQSK